MLLNNRVIFNDNGTLRDLSVALNNVFSGSEVVAIVAAEDKMYFGAPLPFNHRYFMVPVVNDQASVVSVDIWNGTEWVAAVDVIDQTKNSSGHTLSRSGIISWAIDRQKSWGMEDTTENMTGSGLTTLKLYNLYWVRFSFSGNLKATTALKYVGHKFSEDNDLKGYYPDLLRTNVKAGFEAGKTDWDEQHVIAAEEIIRDLIKKQEIINANQILDWSVFTDAATHKVAEIAYTAFGADYEDRRETAYENYKDALDKVTFPVDKNQNGHREPEEAKPAFGRLVRR
jgi:hypothetical protein